MKKRVERFFDKYFEWTESSKSGKIFVIGMTLYLLSIIIRLLLSMLEIKFDVKTEYTIDRYSNIYLVVLISLVIIVRSFHEIAKVTKRK